MSSEIEVGCWYRLSFPGTFAKVIEKVDRGVLLKRTLRVDRGAPPARKFRNCGVGVKNGRKRHPVVRAHFTDRHGVRDPITASQQNDIASPMASV